MFSIENYVYKTFGSAKEYGNPVSDIRVNCPFCESRIGNDDSGHHLYIGLNAHVVHCFRCDYKASWVGFIMDYSGYPYHKAIGLLYETPSSMVGYEAKITSYKTTQGDAPALYSLPDNFIPIMESGRNGKIALNYLHKRGFGTNHCKLYNLGIADSVPHRIIIPIERGYWQGRAIYKWIEPKYINPGKPTTDVLFNAVALELYNEVVVCEGAFSAMAVGKNAIAILKNSISNDKLKRMLSYYNVVHFIIALEPRAFVPMMPLLDTLVKAGKKVTLWDYRIGDPADKDSDFRVVEYNMKTKLSHLMNIS